MKKHIVGLLAALALFVAGPAFAQVQTGGATTSQQAQHYDAGNAQCSIATAVNASQAAGTCTITPPAGQFLYITALQIGACQDGTASISGIQLNFTTSNLGGLVFETSTLSAATITTNPFVNLCAWTPLPLLTPLKSAAPGTAVVITPPAQTAHMSFPITVIGYFSP